MEKFLNEVGSSYWWISVFIVGLIINILAGLAFKYISDFISIFSTRLRKKKEDQELKDLEEVEKIRGNDVEKVIQASTVIYLSIRANTWLLFVVIFIMLSLFIFISFAETGMPKHMVKIFTIPIMLCSLGALMVVLKYFRNAKRENKILLKARNLE